MFSHLAKNEAVHNNARAASAAASAKKVFD
jgi:hypothetical protein